MVILYSLCRELIGHVLNQHPLNPIEKSNQEKISPKNWQLQEAGFNTINSPNHQLIGMSHSSLIDLFESIQLVPDVKQVGR